MKHYAIVTLSILFFSSSCAPIQNGQQPYVGAGIGASIGALVGQAIGHNTEGTVIGGAVGAIVGYAIAAHIVSKNNQIAGTDQTRKSLPQGRNQSQALLIDDQSITPSPTLRSGERATVRVQYKLLDDHKSMIPYKEEKTIWYNGQLIQYIGTKNYTLEEGTYESTAEFTLPEDAAKGSYEFRQRITTDSMRKSVTVPFTVI